MTTYNIISEVWRHMQKANQSRKAEMEQLVVEKLKLPESSINIHKAIHY